MNHSTLYQDKAAEPEQVSLAGGQALSSKIPAWYLIPTEALDSLAARFEAGVRIKKEKSWNAVSHNQDVVKNIDFLIDRLGHVARHAMLLRDKLHKLDFAAIEADDDAGAILFGGALMACGVKALLAEKDTLAR